jgi:hypothetical protein
MDSALSAPSNLDLAACLNSWRCGAPNQHLMLDLPLYQFSHLFGGTPDLIKALWPIGQLPAQRLHDPRKNPSYPLFTHLFWRLLRLHQRTHSSVVRFDSATPLNRLQKCRSSVRTIGRRPTSEVTLVPRMEIAETFESGLLK